MKTTMKSMAATLCGLFMVTVCCGTTLLSDDDTKNRAEVKEFYDKLKNAQDLSLLDEICLPEGMTKEQFSAELDAKRKAWIQKNDSTKQRFAKYKEQRDAYLKALRVKRVEIDSIRKLLEAAKDELGIANFGGDANFGHLPLNWRKDSIDLKSVMEKHRKLPEKGEKPRIKHSYRKKFISKINKKWLEEQNHLKKYLKIDENGRLRLKGEVNYDKIINNSKLTVRERKEAIALLYLIAGNAKGKQDNKTNRDYDECIDYVAERMGYSGSSAIDQCVRYFIGITKIMLEDGMTTDAIYLVLHEEADNILPPFLSNYMHIFVDTYFDIMVTLIVDFC